MKTFVITTPEGHTYTKQTKDEKLVGLPEGYVVSESKKALADHQSKVVKNNKEWELRAEKAEEARLETAKAIASSLNIELSEVGRLFGISV